MDKSICPVFCFTSEPYCRALTVIGICLFSLIVMLPCNVAGSSGENDVKSLAKTEWGGHLRVIGTATFPDPQSVFQWISTDPYYDGQMEVRLKNQTFFAANWTLETHLELIAIGGDTLHKTSDWRAYLSESDAANLFGIPSINDNRHFFNLTHHLADKDDYIAISRLDRLNLGYTASWGSLRVGRQALTWGNGLVFNPMDLFNPFSPSSVLRDYKIGDDMINLQWFMGPGEMQLVYVPHRSLTGGDIKDEESTYAAKWHQPVHAMELDLMVARYYGDTLLGVGINGYIGGAAWRINAVYNHINDNNLHGDYLEWLANLDYAWQWFGHNVYGFAEVYYNGLGKSEDYADILEDTYILERIDRGDQFALGQSYLAGQIQVEHHPLVHSTWTVIVNLADASGLLQPQVAVDLTTNWQMLLGGELYWGEKDTEFGGYPLTMAGATFKSTPSDRIYFWLTYYF